KEEDCIAPEGSEVEESLFKPTLKRIGGWRDDLQVLQSGQRALHQGIHAVLDQPMRVRRKVLFIRMLIMAKSEALEGVHHVHQITCRAVFPTTVREHSLQSRVVVPERLEIVGHCPVTVVARRDEPEVVEA